MQTESLWWILLGCGAATLVWRVLGVVVVKRIDARGEFFQWITCVSYAMVAGLVLRMILLPESELANVSLPLRVAALGIAFGAYYLCRRRLVAGVLAGGLSLTTMVHWFA